MPDPSVPAGTPGSGRPRVRTYHARRGRLSTAHHEALQTLAGRWALDAEGDLLDVDTTFGRARSLVLDIGCGMGDSTRVQAAADADTNVIAIDVHTRGIATLLRAVDARHITNVRVVLGDAVRFIEQRIAPSSLAGARIYFPDPWPKARHAKRRLVQPAFVDLLTDRLEPGGFVHLATDDASYAEQMREVVAAAPRLMLHPSLPVGIRRPVTKYERRARRLGHPVTDIWATRTLSP